MEDDINNSFSDANDVLALQENTKHDSNDKSPELAAGHANAEEAVSPGGVQLIKGKNPELDDAEGRAAPLALLDLPVDVLGLIVVSDNDLASLARTHSALHELAIPRIYYRFDITWQDNPPPSEADVVDALSYGLATLCLPSRFARFAGRPRGAGLGQPNVSHRLTNNDYAKYIRYFSIGKGPKCWSSEYVITKEGGKLLGTLVAIAVAKMVNLETFFWDMPTGVLSDVFMALSSIEDDHGQTKLDKVWVRWHESCPKITRPSSPHSPAETLPPNDLPLPNPIGHHVPTPLGDAVLEPTSYDQSYVEYPTFSILPPLRSLTVLEIDSISYLDEMSVLIERSASRLRELRVGLSMHAYDAHDFTQTWDGANLQQVDHEAAWPGESRIPRTRLGGVLGVLVGRIHDIRKRFNSKSDEESMAEQKANLSADATPVLTNNVDKVSEANSDGPGLHQGNKRLDGKLKLETLALERVVMSIAVLSRAIDWRHMTSLTLLNCPHHEPLWRMLKRQFQPTTLPIDGSSQDAPLRYHLPLKYISTDAVSLALMTFMKETIAPDTLETFILLDRQRSSKPPVTLEQIFKYVIKRQRHSLRRLAIDSSTRAAQSSDVLGTTGRCKYWMIKDEYLSYIMSGRMTSLEELSMVIGFKDWHMFLQQLPQMANLHSLYLRQIIEWDRRDRRALPEGKEFVRQIAGVVGLRREMRLAHVGLLDQCFELVEADDHDDDINNSSQDGNGHVAGVLDAWGIGENGVADNDTDTDGTDIGVFAGPDDEFAEETSDDGESEADSFAEAIANRPGVRLRETPFIDETVEIFRARHGTL
ncbi:hypothetical protein F4802DRAFT_601901 [Xylaria palmicola]|nr:hypothetical protein F4802DRAFT_601901 [Xylaria palmicola]